MSAGDCLHCGGDGFLPGSLGAARCPVCNGTGNLPVPVYENPRAMLVVIIVLLVAIACVLVGGCWLTGGVR